MTIAVLCVEARAQYIKTCVFAMNVTKLRTTASATEKRKDLGVNDYQKFLEMKTHEGVNTGFKSNWMPDILYPFQKHLVDWSLKKGRGAIFADCGLGKTFIQLTWAQNIIRKTNKPVLILTPLSVATQTVGEGAKLGVKVHNRRDGIKPNDKLIVTNYERLHYFDSNDFAGIVCDESSILKNYDGTTRGMITDFMRKTPYRLLCTATAAPNDYIELGTSSEALGEMGCSDVISRFFKKVTKTYTRRDEHRGGIYRFRGYAERHFWRWVCSWARSLRRPSDIGFDDEGFVLPPMKVQTHKVLAKRSAEGMLFDLPATNFREEREAVRRTITERCEKAAEILNSHSRPGIAWCHLNDESALLKNLIDGAVEVKGSDTDEQKEDKIKAFTIGEARVMVTKPRIGGFGMNWQHCADQTYFPSHSYEQYYQAIRRSWRYGQEHTVNVDIISTDGQSLIFDNLKRKTIAADKMFDMLVKYMKDELEIKTQNKCTQKEEVPSWL